MSKDTLHADAKFHSQMPFTNVDAFRSWLLGLGTHAAVIGPPDLRASIVQWLQGVAAQASW